MVIGLAEARALHEARAAGVITTAGRRFRMSGIAHREASGAAREVASGAARKMTLHADS